MSSGIICRRRRVATLYAISTNGLPTNYGKSGLSAGEIDALSFEVQQEVPSKLAAAISQHAQ
ncbi:MAG: hypothetical protein IPL35_00030 [Sphingobacteriales bacterium]|nr:hypothetical protein [Sphingobacteriales bacterium]